MSCLKLKCMLDKTLKNLPILRFFSKFLNRLSTTADSVPLFDNFVNDAVIERFFGAHKVIAVGILINAIQSLAGVLN